MAEYLFNKISRALEKEQAVLLLVAGGSAIGIAVETANRLARCQYLDNLTVSLTDERYGQTGHQDSNWLQLVESGFKLPGAKLVPVLTGKNMGGTAEDYSRFLTQALNNTAYSVALAGMGPDGHIFGIKPGSPAVDDKNNVVAYEWEDYQRITPTINLISKLDEVVVYAVGEEKHQQFDDLQENINPSDQPAQLLKNLKQVTIFNDNRGDEA